MLFVGIAGLVGALLFGGGAWLFLKFSPATEQPSETRIRLKIVQPEQILPDGQGGFFVVYPDVQLSNPDDTPAVVNIGLSVERERGVYVHFESSASRIPEIEAWLATHGMPNPNFLGRQINIPAKMGVNGYMVFHTDKGRLEMAMISPKNIRDPYRLSFQLEQFGRPTKTVSTAEAMIGKEIKK